MLLTKQHLDLDCRRELQSLGRGKVQFDLPMSQHTTFGVGGPADAWVEPADRADLAAILAFCNQKGVGWFVMGQGTNLLVTDRGIRGVVLRLSAAAFRKVEIDGTRVVAGAGASNARLLDALKEAGLSGMEFVCGIPGCVGGGVAMNAGAHGSCFADRIREIAVMEPSGKVRAISRDAMDFTYRGLRNLGDALVLSAALELESEARDRIQTRLGELLEIRNATQPKGSSPGCVFKNPAGQSAGKVIDSLGLKGTRVGGAWISDLHGNFILNDRTASSREVIELIEKVRTDVLARTGIHLETEVKIVGE